MLTPFDRWAVHFILDGSTFWLMVIAGVLGWLASRWCWHWIDCLTWDLPPWSVGVCAHCGAHSARFSWRDSFRAALGGPHCSVCGHHGSRRWLASVAVPLLFAVFVWAVAKGKCQSLTSGGSVDWIHWRILYHLILITLLIVATGIDFKTYLIPDSITFTGMILGVLGATWFGNLQLIPVWIDANQEVPKILGPYIPEWIKLHSHWHGLAWSLAGLVAGGAVTWLVRAVSSAILGLEALGFGDVTLMAMIGSFVGWQAVLVIFALAPLCGMCLALIALLLTGKPYVPYGPYLSASTLVVLFTWQWLWTPLRFVFGHPPTIAALIGGSLVALAILLAAIRLFRAIPGKQR